MGDRLIAATRKGLFELSRGDAGWVIDRVSFLGDAVSIALEDPRDRTCYAALNLGHFGVKLRRREPGGEWEEVAVPDYREEGTSLQQIWCLEPGGADEPGVLWAGTIPGGLFRSEDRGESWTINESLWSRPEREKWFGGGYDHPGIHSVELDPRDSARLAVGVSCGGVWISEDRGATWETRTRGMFAEYMPAEKREAPEIQDPHRLVRCPAAPDVLWVQHHNGAFMSRDEGRQWQSLSVAPSSFGFAVAVHPQDPDTAWFAPAVKDECRVPVDGRVVVSRTRDGGKTFEVLSEGLPGKDAYDLVFRHALAVDGTGRTVALGSTTGSLWISEDGGDRFESVSAHLPPIFQVRFAEA